MKGRADLHCHTTSSDGSFSPKELVEKAETLGLSTIAVCDHDTIFGLEEATRYAKAVEVVPGVEISTDYLGRDVHILGYFIDVNNDAFKNFLKDQREKRFQRASQMVRKLNDLGIPLDVNLVISQSDGKALGRPHIARAMMKSNLASSWEEVFTKYIGKNSPAYVERAHLTPFEAIKQIQNACGVSSLAHPGISQVDFLIGEMVEAGLDGIECTYPLHSPSLELHYRMMADNYNLIATGGSDCHGPDSKSGVILGKSTVDCEVVETLREKSMSRRQRK